MSSGRTSDVMRTTADTLHAIRVLGCVARARGELPRVLGHNASAGLSLKRHSLVNGVTRNDGREGEKSGKFMSGKFLNFSNTDPKTPESGDVENGPLSSTARCLHRPPLPFPLPAKRWLSEEINGGHRRRNRKEIKIAKS